MANNIVQLTDYDNNNIYPIAGAAAQGSITKTMLDEGVFVGAELSDPGNIAYVGTADIQDNAVTAPKLGIPCPVISENLSEPSSVAYVATDNIQDNAVTSDKIDYTTLADAGYAYKTGVTYTEGTGTVLEVCPAFITSSQTVVWSAITLPKPVYGATSINITKLIGSMRTVAGQYISGGQRDWANILSSATLVGTNVVQFNVNVSGLTNIPTNNTPITFSIEGDFTFSFS